LSLCPIVRGFHRLRLLGHFHNDVSLTLGQGIHIAIRGLDHSDCEALKGEYDRVEGDLAREGLYGCTFPQRKSSSLAGGGVRAEGTAIAGGSPSWRGTLGRGGGSTANTTDPLGNTGG
jgi:hypothetical protein